MNFTLRLPLINLLQIMGFSENEFVNITNIKNFVKKYLKVTLIMYLNVRHLEKLHI